MLPTVAYSRLFSRAVVSLQMSRVFDVSDSSAVTDFLRNERPLWPPISTPCPVPECTSDKNYEGLTTSRNTGKCS